MLAGLVILVLAVLLFVYWYFYACTLTLSAKREPRSIARVAAANGLSFLLVQTKLKDADTTLDALGESLDHDYRVLRYLLRYAAGERAHAIEQWMLFWDYQILRVWYRCARPFSTTQARKALVARSRILSHLAHHMGQRTTTRQAA
jgi:hypothetical protein